MTLARGGVCEGLLRLGVVIGSTRLLELILDEIFLQLLPIADHKLFGEILKLFSDLFFKMTGGKGYSDMVFKIT